MASNEIDIKRLNADDELTPMICPIVYTNSLPDPEIGCKLLPCAKTLNDYVEEPISLPDLELQYTHNFKGLHMLLNIDLVNPKAFENTSQGPMEMEEQDAALLADIEPLSIDQLTPEVQSPNFDSEYLKVKSQLDKWIGNGPTVTVSPLAAEPNILSNNLVEKKPKKHSRNKRSKEDLHKQSSEKKN